MKYNQKDCFEDLQFFSIAIDERTDTTGTAVFVSEVNGDFHVVENFVQLLLTMGTTTAVVPNHFGGITQIKVASMLYYPQYFTS